MIQKYNDNVNFHNSTDLKSDKYMNWWKKNDGKVKLWASMLGVLLFAWFFGIRATVRLWADYRVGLQAVAQLQSGSDSTTMTGNDSLTWKALLEDGKILGQIDSLVRRGGLTVIKYTPMLTFQENGWQIHSGELVVSGGFIHLLGLADYIRKNSGYSRLVSLNFHINKDLQRRQKQLFLTLFIQQISETNEP